MTHWKLWLLAIYLGVGISDAVRLYLATVNWDDDVAASIIAGLMLLFLWPIAYPMYWIHRKKFVTPFSGTRR